MNDVLSKIQGTEEEKKERIARLIEKLSPILDEYNAKQKKIVIPENEQVTK